MMSKRSRIACKRMIAAALTLASAIGPAHAWGPRGHRIATKVAEARLSAEAKKGVRELLLDGDTLADVAGWADHEGHDVEPNSAPWHYINVPIQSSHVENKFVNKPDGVLGKIAHYRKQLADLKLSKRDRARALLFFMHFVEDVHQPLHVGDNDDRGGNLTQVQYFNEGTNLHRIWDSSIIEDASRDDRAWLQKIEPLLTPAHIEAWSKGDPRSWAEESLNDAKIAYHFPKGAGQPLPSGAVLGRDYSAMALPIIRQRLAQAGVRLANELNAIFAEDGDRRRSR